MAQIVQDEPGPLVVAGLQVAPPHGMLWNTADKLSFGNEQQRDMGDVVLDTTNGRGFKDAVASMRHVTWSSVDVFNVNRFTNQLRVFESDGGGSGTFTTTVPVGQYNDGVLLAAALALAMKNASVRGYNYKVTFDSLTRKFKFDAGAGNSYTFLWSQLASSLNFACPSLFGMAWGEDVGGTDEFTPAFPISLTPLTFFDIATQGYSAESSTQAGHPHALVQPVPILAAFGDGFTFVQDVEDAFEVRNFFDLNRRLMFFAHFGNSPISRQLPTNNPISIYFLVYPIIEKTSEERLRDVESATSTLVRTARQAGLQDRLGQGGNKRRRV